MHDERVQTQRGRASELVREGIDGLPPAGGIRARQVDQVRAVSEGVAQSRAAPGGAKGPRVLDAQRRGRPLPLVLDEDLDGAAPERPATLGGQGQSAGDGDVRAKLVRSGPRPEQAIMKTGWCIAETRWFRRRSSMKAREIPSTFTTTFEFDYGAAEPELRRLYENAKRDQWNASRDIAWATPGSDDGRIIADELIDIYGSPLWDRLSEKDRVALNRRIAAWRLCVLMYGEQGALLTCSQLVDVVEGVDQKFFQATQVMDEARHNEVLDRYITERLDNLRYPMPKNEREIFDSILTESRWYLKTIALQLVAETFAVALFKMMGESARDPVLGELCRRVLLDESRHMGFGMLALPKVIREASETERRELEDYTCFALEKTLTGFFPAEAYEDMGFGAAEMQEVRRYRRETAASNDYAPFRKYFRRDMHGSMVANLARLGLLTERVKPRLEKLGITLPAR
jgi:hypothetical protein